MSSVSLQGSDAFQHSLQVTAANGAESFYTLTQAKGEAGGCYRVSFNPKSKA